MYEFNMLYKHYKNTFDMEMRMYLSNTTYADLKKKQQKSAEWL